MPLIFSKANSSRAQRTPLSKATDDPILTPAGPGLTQVERAFVLLFADSMRRLKAGIIPESLRSAFAALGSGQPFSQAVVDAAVERVIAQMNWAPIMDGLRADTVGVFQQKVLDAGSIRANVPRQYVARFAFDAADPRALRWAEAQAGALIREIDNETRDAIKKIVLDALRGDYSGDDAAEMVSRVIGLNSRQTRAVENLYQNTVKSLTDDGVSPTRARARARQMADAYRDRLIESRGKMIARTEIMRASNNGRMLAWAQAYDDGLIAQGTMKEWRTYPGFGAKGPCPECLELRGVTVEVFAEFPNGVLMPPAHPYCRCTAILVPPSRGIPTTAPVGGGYALSNDPIAATLNDVIDDSVEKNNPYRDRSTGRFTFGPGGGAAETGPVAYNIQQPLFGESSSIAAGDHSQAQITIDDVEGTGAEAAREYLDTVTFSGRQSLTGEELDTSKPHSAKDLANYRTVKNGRDNNNDFVSDRSESDWIADSSGQRAASMELMIPGRVEFSGEIDERYQMGAFEMHRSIASNRPNQPTLWRGVDQRMMMGEGEDYVPLMGDSLNLPLSSFSMSPMVAASFTGQSYPSPSNLPGARNGSTVIRLRAGSRGHRLRPDDSREEMEVVSAGQYRVTGYARIRFGNSTVSGSVREVDVIDVEQIGVYDPIRQDYIT